VAPDGILLSTEERRHAAAAELQDRTRSDLGQVFTPSRVAEFMAGLLDYSVEGTLRVLDPGAGIGSLSAAVVARAVQEGRSDPIHLDAFEIDPRLRSYLRATLDECEHAGSAAGIAVATELHEEDFIAWATEEVVGSLHATGVSYSACVMNPPYRKINNGGADRRALERVGLRVSNLYAAFVALALGLLRPDGQLVAITPRSFANGPYFREFREFMLRRASIDHLHVYEKRGLVFADSDVLQENVIFRATRDGTRAAVTLSTSRGHEDVPESRTVTYDEVVQPDDPESFIRIPIDRQDTEIAEWMASLPATLGDLGLNVSTGRVVDFRAKEHLRSELAPGCVPLVYPANLRHAGIVWPQPASRKAQAIASTATTASLFLPNEDYVLVKRFTSKEERRRVVAALATPDDFPGDAVAFENHLNVFHAAGRGLDRDLAMGLACFLNSTNVDTYVRQFSGHTQINATDLRTLRYPSADDLIAVGRALDGAKPEPSASVDRLVEQHTRSPVPLPVAS